LPAAAPVPPNGGRAPSAPAASRIRPRCGSAECEDSPPCVSGAGAEKGGGMAILDRSPLSLLTPRELACLRLVSHHLTSKAIAKELNISPYTVDKHLREALQKLS